MNVKILCTIFLFISQTVFSDSLQQTGRGDYESQSGHIQAKIVIPGGHIPLNKIHSWEVFLSTSGKTLPRDLQLFVDGGMPAHKHGMPTTPSIKRKQEHHYQIQGLKFQMTGKWKVVLDLREHGQRLDQIHIDFYLKNR